MKQLTILTLFIASFAYSGFVVADFKAGGNAYLRGDYTAAAEAFTPLAKRGDHRAMYALGSMYAEGRGVEKDLKKAFSLFSEAAKNGRADAMYKLGIMHEEGLGTKKNLKKAIRLYQKSAKKSHPLGQYRFGLMYLNGKGVKTNTVNAYTWLVFAAHYFIFSTAKQDSPLKTAQHLSPKARLLLVQRQEEEQLLEEILNQLQTIRTTLVPADVEKIKQKLLKYRRYSAIQPSPLNETNAAEAKIENLFLPETLY